MPKTDANRLFKRRGRYYADLRDFGDVLGPDESDRPALTPSGARSATTDRKTALLLVADKVEELQRRRREKIRNRGFQPARLKAFAAEHLAQKAKAGKVTKKWLEQAEHHLSRASDFFGPRTFLHTIDKTRVAEWIEHLSTLPNGRGGTLSGSTVHHHLSSLSNLYRRASSTHVPPGFNPVAEVMEKPTPRTTEAEWLEVPDAALVLEAARLYRPDKHKAKYCAITNVHPIVATFLLTGGRKSEVLGLDVEDVSFDRKIIRFRPNEHRRLKTSTSHRTVPLFPQLEEILRPYVFGGDGPKSGLLFPSPKPAQKASGRITDLRKILDQLAERTGLETLRTKMFRHTYCTARLMTYDLVKAGEDERGDPILRPIPISKDRVAREMGHGGTKLVERIYGHYGHMPHRSEHVEYRVDQHEEELGERLTALQATA